LWVYYDTAVSTATNTTPNFVVLTDNANSLVQFGVRDAFLKVTGIFNAKYVNTTVTPPVVAAWHHLVYTDDGAGTPAIYVDGVSTDATSAVPLPTGPTLYVRIGSWTVDPADPYFQHFVGSMDDVRIYSRALSKADVTTLYNAGRPAAPNRVDASGS
jgi:hypothetical protein